MNRWRNDNSPLSNASTKDFNPAAHDPHITWWVSRTSDCSSACCSSFNFAMSPANGRLECRARDQSDGGVGSARDTAPLRWVIWIDRGESCLRRCDAERGNETTRPTSREQGSVTLKETSKAGNDAEMERSRHRLSCPVAEKPLIRLSVVEINFLQQGSSAPAKASVTTRMDPA